MTLEKQDTGQIKLVLVDDNATFRDSLERWLAIEPNLSIVAMAASGQEAQQLASVLAPNIVLLDVHLPDRFGLDLIGGFKSKWPDCKVIVLTFEDEPFYYKAALAAGATDVVVKRDAPFDLLPAIIKAMAGLPAR